MTSCLDGGLPLPWWAPSLTSSLYIDYILLGHTCMSNRYIVKSRTLRLHPAWIIATLQSRDHESSLYIVRCCHMTSCLDNGPPPRMVGCGGTCRPRGHDSSLYIVRVHTLRPDNGWLIALYSKVLPNDVRVQRSLWVRTTHSKYTYEYSKSNFKYRHSYYVVWILQLVRCTSTGYTK